MRVVSWNVNGIRACVKRGFADFLPRSGADILGVQEVRARPEEIPDEARAPAGWHTTFSAVERRGYSGIGLYSLRAPERVECTLGEARFDVEGRYIAARFRSERGRFVVVNAYFPNGSGKNRDNSRVPYKLDFYRAVFERVQRMRRRCPVLVIGDYNTAHREIDIARPKANVGTSGFLPVERAEIDRWLDAGWVDTFRALHPGPAGPLQLVVAAWRRTGAQRRLADRLRARLAGGDEARAGCLHLAARDGLGPLPGRRRHRPLASPHIGAVRSAAAVRHDRARATIPIERPTARRSPC